MERSTVARYERTQILYGSDLASDSVQELRLKALKTLAVALMREVDAIVKTPVAGNGGIDLAEEVRRFERNLICNALVRAGGRQRRAAKLLGLKVTTLNAKIKRHGIDWESARMTGGESDAAGLPLLKMVA